jgi:hypothetical protein
MMQQGIQIRGMFRVQIDEGGKIVGDSGWHDNLVTNLGFNQYLVSALGAIAGSKQVSHMALGTGTAPGAADTTLNGELGEAVRAAVTAATSSSSKTVRFTATFASAASFVTATRAISNVGLFNSSATGTLFAANTFASSSVATNQAVNATWMKSSVEFLVTGIKKLRKFGGHLLQTIPSQQQAFACGRV